jgi:hypothetical protein
VPNRFDALRLGRQNVVEPFPPNFVPKRVYNAWYPEILRVLPSHKSHPEGSKLNENNEICPKKGSIWFSLVYV